MPLGRYRDIIPDWRAFQEACAAPEPITIRARTRFASVDEVKTRLDRQGFDLAKVGEVPGFLRIESGSGSSAQTVEHWMGHFHIQQVVMGLPSLALAPRPGEAVLDLCAAPGGKTVHLAELMDDRGPLVAVDPKEKRLRGLLANVYRLGHPNVLVVAADGRSLPESAAFDRVLVDVPCSAEGNVRRQRGRLPTRRPDFVSYVTTLQRELLRHAIRLTRPGGIILYSTCTFAPEENEAVLDEVLREAPVSLEPIRLEVPHAPGLTEWQGQPFHHDLTGAWRVYPHHLNSGGLFMARLRRHPERGGTTPSRGSAGGIRASESADDGWSSISPAFPGQDEDAARNRISRAQRELGFWFGSEPTVFDDIDWMVRTDNIWAHTADRWPIPGWRAEGSGSRWRVVSLGIRALREKPHGREIPSSHFLTRWAHRLAPDRKLHLERKQLIALLENGSIPLPTPGMTPGYVAIVEDGRVLGRGRVGKGLLHHEIKRAQASRLLALLT